MDVISIVHVIVNFFVAFAVEKFMRVFFAERKTPRVIFALSYLFYAVGTSVVWTVFDIPLVSLLCNIVILFLITLNYESSLRRKISAVFTVYAFLFVADILVASISGHFNVPLLERNEYGFIWGIVAFALVMYLIATLAQNFKNIRRNNPVSGVYWISSVAIPVFSIFLMVLILGSEELSQAMVVAVIVVVFLINVLTFYLHDSLSKAYEDKLSNTLLEQEKEYYYNQCELMSDYTETLKSFKHDIQKHLSTIGDYVDLGKYGEVSDYLAKLSGKVATDTSYSVSGNTAFDSIINYKLSDAAEKGIEIDVVVTIPQKINIEVIDIVTILGNLLDNAVAASQEADNKRIFLKVNFDKGRVVINVENTFSGEVKYANNAIVSCKGEGHGYGLKNVQKSVDNYDGYLEINHGKGIFSVDVLLYVTSKQQKQ
jgi:signal transduction histidine kinase